MAIGTTLKESRAKRGLSLEDIHAKTKIHPRVLQLLEEEKFDKLPSPLFAKSFLKSYSEFLGLNAEDLLGAYDKMERKEPEQALYIQTAAERDRKNGFDKRFILVPGAIAVAFVLVFFLMDVFKTVNRWKVRPDGRAAAQKKEPKAKPATGDTLRSVSAGSFPRIAATKPLDLTVKAIDNVWLRVTCDDKVLFEAILKRGQEESWTAKDKIEIWTGNSSNMQLSLNRFKLGSPGKGVVRKMLITREGLKILG
ncbi:MAG: hypothetical protein A3D28_05610 [Omnitrophica bacterium RIFCSPHIGHO2_02_FULL_63_14]|nr:MAG: hypothetical protein A3D28_05610 [Omnitrophica bacterium RIFCSPHIGHO2_02_FULL_63_14]